MRRWPGPRHHLTRQKVEFKVHAYSDTPNGYGNWVVCSVKNPRTVTMTPERVTCRVCLQALETWPPIIEENHMPTHRYVAETAPDTAPTTEFRVGYTEGDMRPKLQARLRGDDDWTDLVLLGATLSRVSLEPLRAGRLGLKLSMDNQIVVRR